jgi:hypothetical protein
VPEPARTTLHKRSFLRQFVGGQHVAGVDDKEVIYLSYVNQALGSTPYFIVLDPARQAVVLSVRGSSSFAGEPAPAMVCGGSRGGVCVGGLGMHPERQPHILAALAGRPPPSRDAL